MSELEYDKNWAAELTAAGITPASNPINIRGVLKQIIAQLGGSGGSVTSFNTRQGAVVLVIGDVESLFGQKGQLLVGTGSGTGELLAVGASGQVLTAGGADPSGLQWTTIAAGVTSVTAGDASTVVSPTTGAVVVVSGTLDQIASLHPAAADWSNNNHRITALAAGTLSSHAANVGQIPTALSQLSGNIVTEFNTRTGNVVLIASDVESLFTAAGQLFMGTGTNTGTLLAPGAVGTVLTSTGTTTAPTWQSAGGTIPQSTQAGTTYTLQSSDAGSIIFFTNPAAITVTVPSGVFTNNQLVQCVQYSSGQITLSPSGSTLNSFNGSLKTAGAFAGLNVFCKNAGTNEFWVSGMLL